MDNAAATKATGPVTHFLTDRDGFWRILCQRAVGAWRTAYSTQEWTNVTWAKCLAKRPRQCGISESLGGATWGED